jgi:hypothetical protein
MTNQKWLFPALALLVVLIPFGCSDDNGTNPVPAELIGTWWYYSASMDGVPYASYSEVANTQTGVDASVTLSADGTWHAEEYDASQNVVFVQSGTFTATADSITTIETMSGGNPVVDPEPLPGSYVISGVILTITHFIGPHGEYITATESWEKE